MMETRSEWERRITRWFEGALWVAEKRHDGQPGQFVGPIAPAGLRVGWKWCTEVAFIEREALLVAALYS